jgi:hypothetical protein
MFNLLLYLSDNSPINTNSDLGKLLKDKFKFYEYELREECLPFVEEHSALLSKKDDFGNEGLYVTLFFLEQDEIVLDDKEYIKKNIELSNDEEDFLVSSRKRIRVCFSDDENDLFTNSIIDIMQLTSETENSLFIDLNQNKIIE